MPIVEGSVLIAGVSVVSPIVSPTRIIASATIAPETPIDILNFDFTTAGGGGNDVFANWTEIKAGSSTVNRDTSSFNSSPASCRFDIDGSNSFASISQSIVALLGKRIRLSFYGKTTTNGQRVYFPNLSVPGQTGPSSSVYIYVAMTNSWVQYHVTFDFRYYLGLLQFTRVSNANKSLWFDDVQLFQQNTLNLLGTVGYVTRVKTSSGNGVIQLTALNTQSHTLRFRKVFAQIQIQGVVTGTKSGSRRRVFVIA